MTHIMELLMWFFSQKMIMMLLLIPFTAILIFGAIIITVRRN